MNRRLKPLALVSGLLLSALTLLSWTMPWFTVVLGGAESARPAIAVPGETAAPALAALGLAGLALVGALSIAGPAFRIVLGVLQVAIGASVGLSAWGAQANPAAAAAPLVSETTGISGTRSISALIESTTATAWPVATLVIAALLVALGVFVVATAQRWPRATARYQSVRFDEADAPRSAVTDWDSLSDGSDPTSR